MLSLKELSIKELSDFVEEMGEPGYRATQLSEWLYRKGAATFDEMSNLPLNLRNHLKDKAFFDMPQIETEQKSSDGTIKYLLRLKDGLYIESVLIKDEDRTTICLSTQVGCKIGCIFCFTGKRGLTRNLLSSEIIDQIIIIKRKNNLAENSRINIVLMGMGEPLDNYANVLKALRTMTDKKGMDMSPHRITLSTCGLLPEFSKLSKENLHINLAISLNAATNSVRTSLMPINKKYPLQALLTAAKDYPLPKRKRITIEYIMIKGVNDSEEDAKRLAGLLKGIRCKINLISFNNINSNKLKPSSMEQIYKFQNVLKSQSYTAMIRKSKGADITAACGQLGTMDYSSHEK